MPGDPGFLQGLEDLKALHLSKGHDYADASDPLKNYVQSAKDGGVEPWRAAFLRLSEKYHRVINLLAKDEAPNHESLDDTFMDLAAMALIVRSLRARVQEKPVFTINEQAPFLPVTSLNGDGFHPQCGYPQMDALDGE